MNNTTLPEPKKEFETENDKNYKVKAIINSAMYSKEVNNQMPVLYYLVLWKGYLKEESTWKPSATVKHLQILISTFYKEHSEKPTVISLSLDSALSIAKPWVPKE